ncbi:hypothetical protein FIV00_03310 [Labrenzia sp. THAF82]|nr:hypothetical protein FIV00_03310 [Labrenzia sp. THAF82]
MIPSKLMQCSESEEFYAHLIFVETRPQTQATPGEMENTARIMFPKIKEIDLPTWIIGAPMDHGVPVLEIWLRSPHLSQKVPDLPNDFKCKNSRTAHGVGIGKVHSARGFCVYPACLQKSNLSVRRKPETIQTGPETKLEME